jgi:hypothetical protein
MCTSVLFLSFILASNVPATDSPDIFLRCLFTEALRSLGMINQKNTFLKVLLGIACYTRPLVINKSLMLLFHQYPAAWWWLHRLRFRALSIFIAIFGSFISFSLCRISVISQNCSITPFTFPRIIFEGRCNHSARNNCSIMLLSPYFTLIFCSPLKPCAHGTLRMQRELGILP